MTDIGRLTERFADVRGSLFPGWDRALLWRIVAGGGFTESGYMGQCDPEEKAIRIRADLITLPDDALDALIAHEICHAISGGDEDVAWKAEMARAASRALEASRSALAELIRREIDAYFEGQYEVFDRDTLNHEIPEVVSLYPLASFDEVAEMIASRWCVPAEWLIKQYPHCRKVFERAKTLSS